MTTGMQIIEPHYITDAALVTSDIIEIEAYPEWDALTYYVVGQRVTVNDPAEGLHKVYECMWGNDNVNLYPPDNLTGNPVWWALISATNLWKLFDMIAAPERAYSTTNVIGSKWASGNVWQPGTKWAEEGYSSMMVTTLPGDIDAIAILNCDCSSIHLIMIDPVAGVVYNENKTPTLAENFNVIYSGLPSYPNAKAIVIIRNKTSDVNVGEIVFGKARTIGKAKYGIDIGLIDYSAKSTDSFGNFTILERSFSKKISTPFFMDTASHSSILRLLEKYRSVPLVWIIYALYTTTIIYGFYRDLDMTIVNTRLTEGTLSIEGLGADLVYATVPDTDYEEPWSGIVELTAFGMASIATPTLSAIAATPVLISSMATLTAFGMTSIATPSLKVHTNRGTCTISNAEPCVITLAAHGLVEDQEVFFTTTGAVPSPLIADHVYYCANPATNTMNISLTPGGSTIDTTNAGSGVHTLFARV